MPAIRDRAVIEAKSTVVKVSVQVIRSLIRGVAELDRKIEEAVAAHPDFFIFESLPGSAAVLAPRLLAALGSQRERYAKCRRSASLQWDRAGDGTEWEKEVGTLSLGLSDVFAAELSRVGGTFHRSLAMGAKLLSTTAGARQGTPRGGARVGLSNGFASFSDAGKIGWLMTRADIWPRSPNETHRSLRSLVQQSCEIFVDTL